MPPPIIKNSVHHKPEVEWGAKNMCWRTLRTSMESDKKNVWHVCTNVVVLCIRAELYDTIIKWLNLNNPVLLLPLPAPWHDTCLVCTSKDERTHTHTQSSSSMARVIGDKRISLLHAYYSMAFRPRFHRPNTHTHNVHIWHAVRPVASRDTNDKGISGLAHMCVCVCVHATHNYSPGKLAKLPTVTPWPWTLSSPVRAAAAGAWLSLIQYLRCAVLVAQCRHTNLRHATAQIWSCVCVCGLMHYIIFHAL